MNYTKSSTIITPVVVPSAKSRWAEPSDPRDLVSACSRGDVELVASLAATSAIKMVNAALTAALDAGSLACARLLLMADPTAWHVGALAAIEERNIIRLQHMLDLLRELRVDGVDTRVATAAAAAGSVYLRALARAGIDLEVEDSLGRTPLFYLNDTDSESSLAILGSCDFDHVSTDGATALAHALANRHFILAEAMLEYRPDVNVRNANGATMLMLAMAAPTPALVAGLLALGADPAAVDTRGATALDYHVGCPENLHALLAALPVTPQLLRRALLAQLDSGSAAGVAALAAAGVSLAPAPGENTAGFMDRVWRCATSLDFTNLIMHHVPVGSISDDVYFGFDHGVQVLCRAAAADDVPWIVRLLDARAKPDSVTFRDKQTALMHLPSTGGVGAAHVLVSAGCPINAVAADGSTALLRQISYSNTECVKFLMQNGAKPLLGALNGQTALWLAMDKLEPEAVELVLTSPKQLTLIDGEGRTFLMHALAHAAAAAADSPARASWLSLANKTLALGADVRPIDDLRANALTYAARLGHLPTIQAVYARGAVPVPNDASEIAATVARLIQPMHITDQVRSDGLLICAHCLSVASCPYPPAAPLPLLLPSALAVEVTGEMGAVDDTPFYFAANNDVALLAAELAGGLDPNMKTENGMTLLHWACAGDAPECVQLLIDAGADVNARDFIGFTPMYYSVHHPTDATATALLEGAPTPTAPSTSAQAFAPIHLAILSGKSATTVTLAAAGHAFEAATDPAHSPLLLALSMQPTASPEAIAALARTQWGSCGVCGVRPLEYAILWAAPALVSSLVGVMLEQFGTPAAACLPHAMSLAQSLAAERTVRPAFSDQRTHKKDLRRLQHIIDSLQQTCGEIRTD